MAIQTRLTILLLSLCFTGFAEAATLHVGPAKPYVTIQSCLNAALPGDICNVHAGSYSEQLQLPRSGIPEGVITLQANAGDTVLVRSSSSPVLNIYGRSYWTITGISFTYDGSGSAPSVVYNSTGANIDHVTVANCRLTLAGGSGSGSALYVGSSDYLSVSGNTIQVTAASGSHGGAVFFYASHLEFRKNTVHGVASESVGRLNDGVVVSGTNIVIEDNAVHDGWSFDNHPDGIVVQADGDRSGNRTANVKVVRNTVYDFSQGIMFDAYHNPIEGANLVANNVVYETSGFRYGGRANCMNGIVIDGGMTGPNHSIQVGIYNNTIATKQLRFYNLRQEAGSVVTIKNNVFLSPQYTTITVASTAGTTLDYNYYSEGDSTPVRWEGTAYTLSGLIAGAGQELNSRSGVANLNPDYTEHSGSNTRGGALNLFTLFTTDRAGSARAPAPTPWDFGAYVLPVDPSDTTPPAAPENLQQR